MLALGMLAQTATGVFVNGVAFLIPALHNDRGLGLAAAGLLVAMPTLGVTLTLVGWGVLVDRVGERLVLTTGVGLTAAVCAAAIFAQSFVVLGLLFLVGGMAAASSSSASGRVVVGWFPPEQRGLAMGIRQMSLPFGIALAALLIPLVARDHGVTAALLVPAVACTLASVLSLGIVNPPRPDDRPATQRDVALNPYRNSNRLWRIHAASALLVVPQTVVWTYALVWLMTDREWSAAAAGLLVTVSQLAGAVGRVGVGALSDRLHSRTRPLRWVAVGSAVSMLALAVSDWQGSPVSVVLLVVASVFTAAPNGLAFTAVAEYSGPFWSGRALGVQNTGQYVTGFVVPPVFGAVAAVSFPLAFILSAAFSASSVPFVPDDRGRNALD